MRDAPSLAIIESLTELWVWQIRVYDPVAMDVTRSILDNDKVHYCDNLYSAAKDADALLVVTEWDEFRGADKNLLKETMKWNIVIDGRNIWSAPDMESKGFIYQGIGK